MKTLPLTSNTEDLTSKIYDYISAVTIMQGQLIDCKTLYGDGSRFNSDYQLFQEVYRQIKEYLTN